MIATGTTTLQQKVGVLRSIILLQQQGIVVGPVADEFGADRVIIIMLRCVLHHR